MTSMLYVGVDIVALHLVSGMNLGLRIMYQAECFMPCLASWQWTLEADALIIFQKQTRNGLGRHCHESVHRFPPETSYNVNHKTSNESNRL